MFIVYSWALFQHVSTLVTSESKLNKNRIQCSLIKEDKKAHYTWQNQKLSRLCFHPQERRKSFSCWLGFPILPFVLPFDPLWTLYFNTLCPTTICSTWWYTLGFYIHLLFNKISGHRVYFEHLYLHASSRITNIVIASFALFVLCTIIYTPT